VVPQGRDRTSVGCEKDSEALLPPAGEADLSSMKMPPERFPGESRDPPIDLLSARRVGPAFAGEACLHAKVLPAIR